MILPYRTRRALRNFFAVLLGLVLLAAVVLFCWVLWLNRYVVYSRDGAKLDFSQSVQYAPGQIPVEPEQVPLPEIHTNLSQDDPEYVPPSNELTQFSGYYVTVEQLKADFDAVAAQLEALPEGSTVALDVKDVRSYVYYTSAVADESTKFDTAQLDGLIDRLQEKGHYLIARIPAFQEYYYILEDESARVKYGLPKATGSGALWLDREWSCYWMNPASDGTLTYLIQLITELRGLGFDEVVLTDFRFPNTDKIRFEGDRLQTLNDTAATLIKACSTDTFCVSFTRSTADLTLPEGRTRLYLTGVSAADADEEAANTALADLKAQVVYITETGDTRYEEFSVLRPLDVGD